MAGSRLTDRRLPLAAICAFVVVVGAWNVTHYSPRAGFDAQAHIDYADGLVPGGHFPQGTGEYYTPPGYYALAGSADWIALKLGAREPHRAGMAINVLFLLGTVLLVAGIARRLWPGRRRIELGAAAFVAALPVVVETEAMFHPETLSLFMSTLAVWLCVRTFADARYAWALGIVLGAAQLVRAFALWTVAAAVIALLVGRCWRQVAIVVVLAALVPAPWYIHQRVKYHGAPEFPQPVTAQGQTAAGKPKPIFERRPLAFYLDPGLPALITSPYSRHFLNRAIPTTYAGIWGDYFGTWAWLAGAHKGPYTGPRVTRPSAHARRELTIQSLVGLLPTLLALIGWAMFARASLRHPPWLVAALLPLLGVLGYLYFTVGYPTPDGDVLKATYMLTTVTGWALGFGYLLDRLRGRLWHVTLALLVLCILVELPFLIY